MSGHAKIGQQPEAFCRFVAQGMTQRDAYRMAYPKSANWKDASVDRRATRLRHRCETRILELMNQISQEAVLETRTILAELARLARSDIGRIVDPNTGKILLPHELDAGTRAAVAAFKIDEYGRIEYKFWDKNSAIEKAMRHLGLFERDNAQKPPPLPSRIELVPLTPPPKDSEV